MLEFRYSVAPCTIEKACQKYKIVQRYRKSTSTISFVKSRHNQISDHLDAVTVAPAATCPCFYSIHTAYVLLMFYTVYVRDVPLLPW